MKMSWRGVPQVAVMALLGMALFSGCSGQPSGGNSTTSSGTPVPSAAAKTVGSLEQEQIFELPEFKKAKADIEDLVKKKQKEVGEIPRGKPPTPEMQKKLRDMQMEVQRETGKILNPLKQRAEAAVSKVARDKGMLVVLDKKIVVYGVPDITEDVKKTFQAPGELKLPDELDVTKAPIGYFDQEVVRSLKLFQEADGLIYKKRMELMKQFEEQAPKLKPSEKEMLERQLRLKMEAYQEQVMQPLIQQVNDSVKDVAQAQGLSLVLDKQHVMQGGRNMTNEVVEAFLKRAGVPTSKPKPSGSPSAGASAAPSRSPSPRASATPGGA